MMKSKAFRLLLKMDFIKVVIVNSSFCAYKSSIEGIKTGKGIFD